MTDDLIWVTKHLDYVCESLNITHTWVLVFHRRSLQLHELGMSCKALPINLLLVHKMDFISFWCRLVQITNAGHNKEMINRTTCSQCFCVSPKNLPKEKTGLLLKAWLGEKRGIQAIYTGWRTIHHHMYAHCYQTQEEDAAKAHATRVCMLRT